LLNAMKQCLKRPALVFSICAVAGLIVLAQSEPAGSPYAQKSRTFHTSADFLRLTSGRVKLHRLPQLKRTDGVLVGGKNGVVSRSSRGVLAPYPVRTRLPVNDITVIAEERPGIVWLGTRRGAIRYDESSEQIQYFAGQRWLPDDDVTAIGFSTDAGVPSIWIETPKGLSRIVYQQMTLAEKARIFEERIRSRHVRHGFTASSHLRRAGDLSTNQTVSTDNDGLWTAMYVAAECFRFKVTRSPEAREFARQGMQAILRLEAITGIPGFPARSFIKIGGDEQPGDGEWHTTPDGGWKWKGDTSSDEIVGQYFIFGIFFDLIADESEKRQIREVVERITAHIIDHNFQLIDVDGQHTRWGWWGPEAIWGDADETGLRALHILSHLRVASYITGNPKFEAAYNDLINKHRYHLLLRNQKINIPGRVNHSDDELAFLSYYPLLSYEKDSNLHAIYRESLERSWQVERAERNPLWNFIYAAGTGSKESDVTESLRTLREIPMDLVSWTVTNSHRLDIVPDASADRFGRKESSLTVLPYDELPMMKWNGNPYRLDGGNGGRSEDDGAYFLLPYWMGRYHRLIGE
jgi:hypothetical protein